MKARVVAIKTALRDLKPGDVYSDMDGSHWNLAMAGRALPQAFIRTNEATDEDISTETLYVYRLSVVKEYVNEEGIKIQHRDAHTSVLVDPTLPPGTKG